MQFEYSKNYDAWLQWNVTSVCNLNCDYCFNPSSKFNLKPFQIDIDNLIKTLNDTGQIFRIGFTGGEPFLVPNFIDASKKISNKHYISINTNLTVNRIEEFSLEVDPNRILFIHASFHYEELKKRNLLDRFVANFHILKNHSFNIYAESVAHPELELSKDDIDKFCKGNDIELKYGPFIGEWNGKQYPESYSNEQILKFNLIKEELNKFKQYGNYCNAGYNAAVVYPKGNIKSCFNLNENLGNIYGKINFNKFTKTCPSKKCGCPLNEYDKNLLIKAKC